MQQYLQQFFHQANVHSLQNSPFVLWQVKLNLSKLKQCKAQTLTDLQDNMSTKEMDADLKIKIKKFTQ